MTTARDLRLKRAFAHILVRYCRRNPAYLPLLRAFLAARHQLRVDGALGD